MKNKLQYITDNNGIKTAVIVPFNEWDKIKSDNNKLQKN